jgi:hypothetical protein
MITINAMKHFIEKRLAFRFHWDQHIAIEEECLTIVEVVHGKEPLDPLTLGVPAPMRIGGVSCITDMAMPRDEIAFEVDGKEVARITGLDVPASY